MPRACQLVCRDADSDDGVTGSVSKGFDRRGRVRGVCPMVNTDDLCDAHEVAALLGLSHATSVSGYLRRYADLPRPVIALGRGRIALWLRPDVEAWARSRRAGPGR